MEKQVSKIHFIDVLLYEDKHNAV